MDRAEAFHHRSLTLRVHLFVISPICAMIEIGIRFCATTAIRLIQAEVQAGGLSVALDDASRSRRLRRPATILAALTITFGLAPTVARAALPSTFTTGFADTVYYQSCPPAAERSVNDENFGCGSNRNMWLSRTVQSGAQFILLWVSWSSVAGQRPAAGTDPSNPANPAYNWGTLDATVRAMTAHGLRVVLSVTSAPLWAEGPDRPPISVALPFTWRPDPNAFAAFSEAVARRYGGSFNPGTGVLPRVRYFQAWTEPNLPEHLNPQWVRVKGHLVAESPILYRSLLNGFYRAVKAVHPSNVVITAGTAPYGDPPGGQGLRGKLPDPNGLRMQPALFWRDVLCLNGQALKPQSCPDPAHFDILAHDPYEFSNPLVRAGQADNVTLPDMWKLQRILTKATQTGRALPRMQHPLWCTEFGWNTRPPSRRGVALMKRAQFIDEGFYELWLQGISTATWYLIRDQPPERVLTWQTGLYYVNGRRKPGFEAFRFPFIAKRAGKQRATVWAVSPDSGTLSVQARESGRWRTVLRARVRAHGVIHGTIAVSGQQLVRGVIRSDVSLNWRA
jgi:hypothetical protein